MLPVVFLDHGSPMEALGSSAYTDAVASVARGPRPEAVVCVSAHWETRGEVRVTASPRPATIHDFAGFPAELHRIRYEAPGEPRLAAAIVRHLVACGIAARVDETRGLDHGTWIPLRRSLPAADVPVLQVSLPIPRDPVRMMELGSALAEFRERGVLLVGSGGIVHNIPLFVSGAARRVMPQLIAFDRAIRAAVEAGDVGTLARYANIPYADLAVPTTEHFDPLLVAVGAARGDRPRWLHGSTASALGMNVVRFGD